MKRGKIMKNAAQYDPNYTFPFNISLSFKNMEFIMQIKGKSCSLFYHVDIYNIHITSFSCA